MAIIAKINPIGLDAVINRLQYKLFDKLSVLWGLDFTVYPRCYEVLKESDGQRYKTIEHYKERGDNTNLIYAEGNKMFFVQTEDIRHESGVYYNAVIELYATVDLKKVKPAIVHRADYEVYNDVIETVNAVDSVTFKSLINGIDNVYRGFRFNIIDDRQPFHCFKLRLEVIFELDQIC